MRGAGTRSGKQTIFARFNRVQLLVGLINQSIIMKLYHIPYEITKRFMSDLLKAKYLPIFDTLFIHFQNDTTKYESKLALIMNCMPLMNKKIAARYMKVLEGVLL